MKRAIAVVLALMFALTLTGLSFAAETKEAPAVEKKEASKHITGDVTAVDAKAMTITVKSKKHEVTVSVNDKTKITAGKDAKTFADVKAGETVSVKYTATDGKNVAGSVDIHAAKKQEAAPAAEKKK